MTDPRSLPLGARSLSPEDAGLAVAVSGGGGCDLVIAQGTTTIDVTRAEGGAAPYPTIVTSDYARELAVHLESSHDNGCNSMSIMVDLELAQRASDYSYDPTTVCGCL